jgi:hypothetical protein
LAIGKLLCHQPLSSKYDEIFKMKKRNGHRNGSNKLKEQTDKLLSTVALACLVGMTLLALYTGKGDQEYYEVQGGLFVCCILEILVSFVIIKYERSVVYSALLKLWKNDFFHFRRKKSSSMDIKFCLGAFRLAYRRQLFSS